MPGTFNVSVGRPIVSVAIMTDYTPDAALANNEGVQTGFDDEQAALIRNLQKQKQEFSVLLATIGDIAAKLGDFYNKAFSEHKAEIAKLSLEIARKVILQKVKKGDYEMESIIQEALNNAPTREDVVVRLNPDDLAGFQKIQQDKDSNVFGGIKFVADSNVGRAECLLESPKGIIESLIDKHLEQIGKALEKAE